MEFEEVVAALAVPSGAELQYLECLGFHLVFSALMGVDVLSKLEGAILGELNELASNHGLWYQNSRYPVLGREAVEPERHVIDNLAHEDNWDESIQSYDLCVYQPNVLLHGPVEAFNFWDVLVPDRRVQLYM